MINTIDLHHGKYSQNPPYSHIHVIGALLNETVQKELETFGFNSFEAGNEGFTARKSIRSEQEN